MLNKIIPTAKQKSNFVLHVIVFLIANATLWAFWYFGQGAKDHWVYPWGIWITAAWALSLIGHWCAVYTNYEDVGNQEYLRQKNN
ncbi:MAG: 2TM domain-containing protein [Chitinophagaceae bacterium]